MFFQIITPARSKQSFLLEGERDYTQRIKQFARFEILELDARTTGKSSAEIIQQEGALILKKVKKNATLIALDTQGTRISSEGLAILFNDEFNKGMSSIAFAIGGPFGLSKAVQENSHRIISLSDLTFTAQFARLILTEQIYRAITILNNLPYHKQ